MSSDSTSSIGARGKVRELPIPIPRSLTWSMAPRRQGVVGVGVAGRRIRIAPKGGLLDIRPEVEAAGSDGTPAPAGMSESKSPINARSTARLARGLATKNRASTEISNVKAPADRPACGSTMSLSRIEVEIETAKATGKGR